MCFFVLFPSTEISTFYNLHVKTCIHFSDEQFLWKVNDDYLLLTGIPSLAKRGDGVH